MNELEPLFDSAGLARSANASHDERGRCRLPSYVPGPGFKVLVFALYKKEAARLEQALWDRGFEVASIHGDKGQQERTSALESFRAGRVPVVAVAEQRALGGAQRRRVAPDALGPDLARRRGRGGGHVGRGSCRDKSGYADESFQRFPVSVLERERSV